MMICQGNKQGQHRAGQVLSPPVRRQELPHKITSSGPVPTWDPTSAIWSDPVMLWSESQLKKLTLLTRCLRLYALRSNPWCHWTGVERDARYPAGKGVWEKDLNHFPISTSTFLSPPPKSRELPLTSDVNEILLNNHFILEIPIPPKGQCDRAVMSGMPEFLHLPGQSVEPLYRRAALSCLQG